MNRFVRVLRSNFFNRYGMLIILVLLILFMGAMSGGRFFRVQNLLNILEQVTPIGIIAIGVTFVIITGGIDLSLGSVIALAGVSAGLVAQGGGMVAGLVALLVAVLVGLLCGLANGLIVAFGRIPPFIVTLGMMTAARGIAAVVSDGRPVGDLPSVVTWLGINPIFGISGVVYIYLLFALVAWILLDKMRYGRHITAIGGNQNAARICGVRVEKCLVLTYMFAGVAAGLSGNILISTTMAANPTYGVMYELDAIASTVIGGTSLSGGKGSVALCIVGTIIVGVINNGLNLLGVDPYWQQVVKGLIIVLAVFLDQVKRSGKG